MPASVFHNSASCFVPAAHAVVLALKDSYYNFSSSSDPVQCRFEKKAWYSRNDNGLYSQLKIEPTILQH